jgi:hypothetical protein
MTTDETGISGKTHWLRRRETLRLLGSADKNTNFEVRRQREYAPARVLF